MAKPTSLLFLLSVFIPSVLAALDAAGPPVLDVDGDAVVAGKAYRIVPVLRGFGGGLTLAERNGTLCPLYVAQAKSEVDFGLPAVFTPASSDGTAGDAVLTSDDLTVNFRALTVCIESTEWHLSDPDNTSIVRYILTGPYDGDDERSNLFRIADSGIVGLNSYIFVHCPCSNCRLACFNVGVFRDDNGSRILGIPAQGRDLEVMFVKAEDDEGGARVVGAAAAQ